MMDDISNLSSFEDTANFTDEVYDHPENFYQRVFLEVFTLVGLISVTANTLLSFVILKYKRLRREPTNAIFLQVNILQAIYLIAAPLSVRVAITFFSVSDVHFMVFCISYQIESNIMFGITWFIFLLLCDWYIKLYHQNTYVKFSRVYKFCMAVLYIIIILTSSLTIQACFRSFIVLLTYLIMLVFAGLAVLILIILNIVHAIKRKRLVVNNRSGHIGLAIANISFACWCPGLIYLFFLMVGLLPATPVIPIILFTLGFSSPVFNLLYLYNYDDNYHIFLRQVFRCRCNDYQNDNLDNAFVRYSDSNSVQISIK